MRCGSCVAVECGYVCGSWLADDVGNSGVGHPIPRLLGSRTKPAAAVHTFNCGARLALRLGIWLPSPFDYLGQVTTA